MEKLKMQSMDKVQYNIEKIREMFPNAVTEVNRGEKTELAVDFDVLKQELADTLIDERELRYQFTWPDKQKSVLLANTPVTATLRPDKEKSVDFDNTQNLYIEGDNLDVLKLLRETYLGKIKMIYIDPPYNTGNDFVYEDDFALDGEEYKYGSGQYDEAGNRLFQNTESNGRFHTDWLNMIYPRLKVAKDLLTDDGVIFISIDDNELKNLQKICEEIFGDAYSKIVIRKIMEGGKSDSTGIAVEHEYCVLICKNDTTGLNKREMGRQEHYKLIDQYFEERGYYYLKPLENGGLGYELSLDYPIIGPDGVEIYPGGAFGDNGYRWVWSKEKFNRALKLGMIEFTISSKDKTKYKVYYKIYEKVDTEGNPSLKELPYPSMYLDTYTNRQAILEIKTLFNTRLFDYPKPVKFIKELLGIGSRKDSIILDFFSGSATTAHAVMQLNAEDGGNRKFIMVQLPEPCDEKSEAYKAGYKMICDIGEERIRRAGKKIKEELGVRGQKLGKGGQMTLDSLTPNLSSQTPTLDIGFRVLRLDSSNMREVYYHPEQYTQTLLDDLTDNIKEDRTPLDLLFQVMLDLGVKPSAKIEEQDIAGKRVFVVNENELIACFDKEITDEVVKAIAKMQPLYAAFRDSSYASDSVAANFAQIFATYSPNTKKEIL